MSDKQIWSKELPLDELVHRFTVGEDHILDMQLLPWDILGSAAHVRMLAHTGLIAQLDAEQLLQGLTSIQEKLAAGQFSISSSQEDCHTAIEQALHDLAPQAAGNVHLGRSRNDQVLTALRLYMKHGLLESLGAVARLAHSLAELAAEHGHLPLPGYTHLRRAMPSSVAQWLLSFSHGLLEELQAGEALLARLDSCPLGSGAGFGVPLPLDREYSARLLGFSRVQSNPIDCANSRGRHELALAAWNSSVGNLLEKFIWDLCLYSTDEFGFISLPDEFTTGSSIMPQKRNPDVLELARGRIAQLRAWRNELEQVSTGLPSNYHRDYQLLKPALFRSVTGLAELLAVLGHVLPGLHFNAERLQQACTAELHAAAEAYRRVQSGELSFREAYRVVGREVLEGTFKYQPRPESNSGGVNSDPQQPAKLEDELSLLATRLNTQSEVFGRTLDSLLPISD